MVKNFNLPILSSPVLGPSSLLKKWTPEALSSRVKEQGREANAEVKKT
jgi:hypothetical protein